MDKVNRQQNKKKFFDTIKKGLTQLKKINLKKAIFSVAAMRQKAVGLTEAIKNYPYARLGQKIKNGIRLTVQKIKAWSAKISDCWKTVLICLLTFMTVYYGIGSQLSENIDTTNGYALPAGKNKAFTTAQAMNFLILRETDDKMWTPNLPLLFPAAVLDNMPNFQKGLMAAVRDMSGVVRKVSYLNETQLSDAKEAFELLNYPPHIWLLSKRGTFGIAPSSNAQYRRAAKRLRKLNERQDFAAASADFDSFIDTIARKLRKIIAAGEEYQREFAGKRFDFRVDDVFYYNRGYAFALWQICRALGVDYKADILKNGVYTEWTFLNSSLRQAAEFEPLWIRNGKPESLGTPNHLMVQNYYLTRALAALEQVRFLRQRGADAN
jgi:hypothetical protein